MPGESTQDESTVCVVSKVIGNGQSFASALENAIVDSIESFKGVQGIKFKSFTVKVKNGKVSHYSVTVSVAHDL